MRMAWVTDAKLVRLWSKKFYALWFMVYPVGPPSQSFPSFILPHIVEINVLWCGALLTALLPPLVVGGRPIMTKAE